MLLAGSKLAIVFGLSLVFQVPCVEGGCRHANWWSSFDGNHASHAWHPSFGLAKCDGSSEFITGFYRNKRQIPDLLGYIEEANCCTSSDPFKNDPTQVVYANWWSSFDQNNHWNTCPDGFFLQGLYRTEKEDRLWSIEEGRCAKPASHPHHYEQCYDHDITLSFDKEGWSVCRDGYFVTGLYRGICDELYCLEKMKCCKMASAPIKIDSIDKAKIKVMDETLTQMANLAQHLGFFQCQGCRGALVGDDFRKQGDNWVADQSSDHHCPNIDNHEVCLTGPFFIPICHFPNGKSYWKTRLNINYANWKFSLSDTKFDTPVTTDLRPETIDTGKCVNHNSFPVPCASLSRSQTVVRTVSHTATDSFTNAEHLGISIGYTPPSKTGGLSASVGYDFNYETTSATKDSTGSQHSETFSTGINNFMVPPNKALNYTLKMLRTKHSVNYTATVRIDFSAQFDSVMQNTNFYDGSGHVHYRFGSDWAPFADDLRTKSDNNERPWRWNDMKAHYPDTRRLIQALTDKTRYEFTLSGRFDDIQGKRIEVEYNEIPLDGPVNPVVG